jgi:glycosyltransferase involved in cell wall biosynthesis
MATHKKKILIVSYGMEIGGIERSLIGLLDAFDYTKYDVDLFLFAHEGEFKHLLNQNVNLLPEIEMMSYIKKPIIEVFKDQHFKLGIIRLYAKLKASIIQKIFKKPGSLMSRVWRISNHYFPDINKKYDLALGFQIPFDYILNHVKASRTIGWVHTDYSNVEIDVEYELKNWKQLDYIAAVSSECKNTFNTIFPSLIEKTIVIENILDPQFVMEQANALNVLNEMPVDGSVRLCSVGRFCEAKAFDEAIIACKKMIDLNYDLKWYIIGYGPDEELLRRMVADNQLENHFILLGKKENPYPYMKACDIYVQPSRYEGKAVTVREAQIIGKPVMITNFPSASSQLENNIDGYICKMGVDGVVDGLKYLLENPNICELLMRNTKKKNHGNVNEIEKIYSLVKEV